MNAHDLEIDLFADDVSVQELSTEVLPETASASTFSSFGTAGCFGGSAGTAGSLACA